MATQYDTQIQQLYVAYFNRPADAGGLAHWASVMANGGTTAQISAAFAQSLEYQVEYSQSTNAGIVNAVYENLFGRPAETEGLAFWVKALTDKTMTVENMVDLISQGAQGSDEVAFDSKVVVATAFTNALDTDAEKAGYSGADANKEAKKLLATIKTAEDATKAIVPATLNASVAAVVKAATPFSLETGLAAFETADKAIADFLDTAKIDVDKDGKADTNVDADAIEDNLDVATTDLAAEIAVDRRALFTATESESVRSALIEEQQVANAKVLKTAQDELKTANTALAGVKGLDAAVASNISAVAAEEDAAATVAEADAAAALAFTTLTARNTVNGVSDITVTGTAITSTKDGVLATLDAESNEWELNDGVTASKYVGLTAAINAANAALAAQEDLENAQLAQIFTELSVDLLDPNATAATELAALSDALSTDPATAGKPTVAEITNELSKREAAGVDADIEAFMKKITDFVDASVSAKAGTVVTKQAAVDGAQDLIDDLAAAVEKYEEAVALQDELDALVAARKVVSDDFVANKFKAPVTIDGSEYATTDADIFVAGDVSGSIASFGRSGDDVLFIGSGYTLNNGALTTGNNAVLEVFFTQKGNNTIVTIETETFGSSASSEAKIEITLTGIDASDLTFENGIITL